MGWPDFTAHELRRIMIVSRCCEAAVTYSDDTRCSECHDWCDEMEKPMTVHEENRQLKDALRDAAETMERWARQSRQGGWSTHQVEPNRLKAQKLFALLGRLSK